ncbi:MAG: universal stress protein [Thermomicrobiales bacterium]
MPDPTATPMTILVPTDGSATSNQALLHALTLAGGGAEITLLHVIEQAEPIRDLWGHVEESGDERTRALLGAAKRDLDALRDATPLPAGVTVTDLVQAGRPARQIDQVASEIGADLVVMGSQGRGAAGRLTFGSVADAVSRSSGPPLMVVHTGGNAASGVTPAPVRRLVVPVDGSEVSQRALPVAVAMARRQGVPIVLLMSVETPMVGSPAFGMDAGAGMMMAGMEDEMATAARETLNAAMETVTAAGIAPDQVSTEVVRGAPAAAIETFTGPGDLIVMASRGRGGVERFLLGSVAERLTRHARCPVILVRDAAG